MLFIDSNADQQSDGKTTDALTGRLNANVWKPKLFKETELGTKSSLLNDEMHKAKVWRSDHNIGTNRETLVYIDCGVHFMATELTDIEQRITIQTLNLIGLTNRDMYQAMETLRLLNTMLQFSTKLDEVDKSDLVKALETIETYDALAFSDDATEDEYLKYSEELNRCLETLLKKYDSLISNHKNSDFNWTSLA